MDLGLALVDVQARARQRPRLKCLDERGLVDDRPARRVDEKRARAHQRQRPRVDQVACGRRERAVERDHVRHPQQLVERQVARAAQ